MVRNRKSLYIVVAIAAVIVAAVLLLHGHNFGILNPKGPIAARERKLLLFTVLLSLIVVLPVYTMTIMIVWKYRAEKKAKYTPDWDHHLGMELAWWGIPSVIIGILSVITWNSAHSLDPYKPLAVKGVAPLTVQVVAMDWKWLFIYPSQHMASVNLLEIPVNTPVNFQITSDAPMNSFWIPQLGGQIYAMPGMETQLHLMASQAGDYHGSSANISGAGFAGMSFTTRATPLADFNAWAKSGKNTSELLSQTSYEKLARPSQNNPVTYYALADNNLLNEIIEKYMAPSSSMSMTGATQ